MRVVAERQHVGSVAEREQPRARRQLIDDRRRSGVMNRTTAEQHRAAAVVDQLMFDVVGRQAADPQHVATNAAGKALAVEAQSVRRNQISVRQIDGQRVVEGVPQHLNRRQPGELRVTDERVVRALAEFQFVPRLLQHEVGVAEHVVEERVADRQGRGRGVDHIVVEQHTQRDRVLAGTESRVGDRQPRSQARAGFGHEVGRAVVVEVPLERLAVGRVRDRTEQRQFASRVDRVRPVRVGRDFDEFLDPFFRSIRDERVAGQVGDVRFVCVQRQDVAAIDGRERRKVERVFHRVDPRDGQAGDRSEDHKRAVCETDQREVGDVHAADRFVEVDRDDARVVIERADDYVRERGIGRGCIDEPNVADAAKRFVAEAVLNAGATEVERQLVLAVELFDVRQGECKLFRVHHRQHGIGQIERQSIASEHEVRHVDAGHVLGEVDRHESDGRVANARRDVGDRGRRGIGVGEPHVGRAHGEAVSREVLNAGAGRVERQRVIAGEVRHVGQIQRVLRRRDLRERQIADADRRPIARQREVAEINAGHVFAELNRDLADRRVSRIGRHIDNVHRRRSEVVDPRL